MPNDPAANPHDKPVIRNLTEADAPDMARLHAQAFNPGWPVDDMIAHVNTDIVIGYETPLTGYIIIRSMADQSEILTLVTAGNARRKGIARALLKAGENRAAKSGSSVMFLEVAEDNRPALELYRNTGYGQIGRRPAYYKRDHGRIAALTFRKELDDIATAG